METAHEPERKTSEPEQPSERRARLYRSRAIVLRRRDLGEADRIITLMTEERGRTRAVARGSRRTSSRLAGHLEPFCVTSVLVAHTRGLDIVSQALTEESFSRLRRDELSIASAGYLAELVDTLVPEEQSLPAVFDLLVASLRLLDDGRDVRLVTIVFEMGLLRQLGYRPQLDPCIVCGESLLPEENSFSPDGGVVCGRCRGARPEALPLGVNALKLLRAMDRGEITRLFALRVPGDALADAEAAMSATVQRIAGRELHSPRVMRQLQLE